MKKEEKKPWQLQKQNQIKFNVCKVLYFCQRRCTEWRNEFLSILHSPFLWATVSIADFLPAAILERKKQQRILQA